MTRHVALLGGINVGGHRVTMERLRAEFASLDLTDVSTFIASGNVVFTAPAPRDLERRIAEHLQEQLGWAVPTFLRTAAELVAAVDLRPFGATPEGHTYMVAFCRERLDPARSAAVTGAGNDVDRFEVHGSEVHWLIRGSVIDSTVGLPRLGRLIGPTTTRNITSLARLAELVR